MAVPPSHNDEVFSLSSDIKYGVSEDAGGDLRTNLITNGFTYGERSYLLGRYDG